MSWLQSATPKKENRVTSDQICRVETYKQNFTFRTNFQEDEAFIKPDVEMKVMALIHIAHKTFLTCCGFMGTSPNTYL